MKLSEKQEADLELVGKVRELKKTFKTLSKNQLVDLLLRQVGISIDQQNANKVLMAENIELKKGIKSE
jgi:hypothetical protein